MNLRMFVILKTKTESYQLTNPVITTKSKWSFLSKMVFRKALSAYMPSISEVAKEYRTHRPDYVIIRPFISGIGLVHFAFALWYCKKIILYSQSPKYRHKKKKNDLLLNLVLSLRKVEWMTPVKYRDETCFQEKVSPNAKINYLQLPHPEIAFEKSSWLENNQLNILIIAKSQSYKNHNVLIQALAKIPYSNYHLRIVGDYTGTDNYTIRILDELERNNLNYELTGYVDHSRIGEVYAKADVLILPSSYEMHGYVINEAVSHGIPLIISSETGTKCLVKDGENGYIFETKSSDDLRNKIELLIDGGENLLKKFSTKAREIYNEELSPQIFLERYHEILDR